MKNSLAGTFREPKASEPLEVFTREEGFDLGSDPWGKYFKGEDFEIEIFHKVFTESIEINGKNEFRIYNEILQHQ